MTKKYAVVSWGEAQAIPYPYVYVKEDGTFRELDAQERQYLEQEFSPFDGARPYVKFRFSSRTPNGYLHGFLHRSRLPPDARSSEEK